jgi:glycosyltransferase involved in cell wall biosynthesis
MGRLLAWKGFHLGIRAFAEARLPETEYWILGDGPERQRLERLARKVGVADRVRFWGRLPRETALIRLKECVALVHPSLHDSGGWFCLEAMGAARPVICLDLGGPGLQVTDETGIKIPAISPAQAVQDIAQAMIRLATDPETRIRFGKAGCRRVEQHYRWKTRGQYLSKLYAEVIARRHGSNAPAKDNRAFRRDAADAV